MNLYSVIYVKGKLIAAMFLWQGAIIQDCEKVNAFFSAEILPDLDVVKEKIVTIEDFKLTCEYHYANPAKEKVKV